VVTWPDQLAPSCLPAVADLQPCPENTYSKVLDAGISIYLYDYRLFNNTVYFRGVLFMNLKEQLDILLKQNKATCMVTFFLPTA